MIVRKAALLSFLIFIVIISCVSAQQSWCGQQNAYFNNSAIPDISGYESLVNFPGGSPEVIESVSVINTGGPVLIDNYIMPAGSLTNAISLEPGIRDFHVYSYVSSATGITQLNFTAFRRFENGTEQNFYTALSGDINSLTVTEYNFLYVSTTKLEFAPTDRLGIRVSANTTHSSPITVYWYYQGEYHHSMFVTGYFDCETAPVSCSCYSPQMVAQESPMNAAVVVFGVLGAAGIYMITRKKDR